MLKHALFFCILLGAQSSFAADMQLYQVDMIAFQQPDTTHNPSQETADITLPARHVIPLDPNISSATTPYHLLPPTSSRLYRDYQRLASNPGYTILFHYSWLQPSAGRKTISLPNIQHQGWNIAGNVNIRTGSYYTLHVSLALSKDRPKQSLTVTQTQRLDEDDVYYLDNPAVGMLVSIHPLS